MSHLILLETMGMTRWGGGLGSSQEDIVVKTWTDNNTTVIKLGLIIITLL